MSFAYTPGSKLQDARLQQLANNYRLTPTTLFAELNEWWIPAPWLQYLGAEIASAIFKARNTGVGCGLLVSAPPRHGKSKLITVATPLWVAELFGDWTTIVATYGEDLSTDFTREIKDLIKAYPDKLNVRIRRDVDRAQNFLTERGGGVKAVGLRGTITGRGANVLVIDDYIKEPKEALNYNYLESLKTWYATVARTRLEPGAVVIIVATRWVTNDLHGHIERLEARRPAERKFYRIIKLPAIAGKWDHNTKSWIADPLHPDLLGRKPGECLFPQRYDIPALMNIREELTPRWFSAMFQQDPASEDSALTDVNNLRYISRKDYEENILPLMKDKPSRFKRRRSWDFASTKDAGDFTAGPRVNWDTEDEIFYIEHMYHGQWSAQRNEDVFTGSAAPQKDHGDPDDTEIVIEQEPGSAGAYAIQHFKSLAKHRRVREAKAAANGSKLLKAQAFLAATERKKVVLVVDDTDDLSLTPWVARFHDEFINFDGQGGGHDDIMDALANAYNDATGKKPMAGAWGRSPDVRSAQELMKGGEPVVEGSRRTRLTWGRSDPKSVKAGSAKMNNMRRSGLFTGFH